MKQVNVEYFNDNQCTLEDLYNALTKCQEANILALVKAVVVKPGLKIDSNNDFAFEVQEGSIQVNIGSCVFNNYTVFVPEGNQSISIPMDWEGYSTESSYSLVIMQDDNELSHAYPTTNGENTFVYSRVAASIAIIKEGSLNNPYIAIAMLDVANRQLIDYRYRNQLQILKPVASIDEDDASAIYSIDEMAINSVYDIDSLSSDKPRPASMHKSRRIVVKFRDKPAFHSESIFGFALKITSTSPADIPQEYFKYFYTGEVIGGFMYLSLVIPHESDSHFVVSVYAFYKTIDSKIRFASEAKNIVVSSLGIEPIVSITPLFDNSGILRFSISNADSSEPVDYFLYLRPANIIPVTPIDEGFEFQTVVQGGEYDYVMPSGFKYLLYKIRAVPYKRAASSNTLNAIYNIYNKESDFEYGMSFYTGTIVASSSGTLFTIPLADVIKITGVHFTCSDKYSVATAGEITIGNSSMVDTIVMPYSIYGEGKVLNQSLIIEDEIEVTFASSTDCDLSNCTLTILYKYVG